MPANSTTFDNPACDTPGVIEKVSEATSQVKNKVSDLGRTAVDRIDAHRGTAANGLESAARVLHGTAENLPGGEKVTSLAHSTADRLRSTAKYVREHDVKSMTADVERLVKNNPGPSLFAAAVIGFLVARAFSND